MTSNRDLNKLRCRQRPILQLICVGTVFLSLSAFSGQIELPTNTYSGHYAREVNNESTTTAIRNKIYIKIFDDQWIALMYIPLSYAKNLDPSVITKAMEVAKSKTKNSTYLRSKFDHFSELVTVHIERYGYLEDRLVFECGSLAPCTIRIQDGFLELIKPGVINEHIIRYDHVLSK